MARIEPMDIGELPQDLRSALQEAESLMGFVPNDALTLARWPALYFAVQGLVRVLYSPGAVSGELKRMVATVVSGAAGCRYCQAHTAHGAVRKDQASAEKIAAVWQFRTSDLFSAAERAALELAVAAGQQPSAATDEHFAALREHFSERAVMEIVGMIALFGFLNRWNDTLATELEQAPLEFALRTLKAEDWQAGRHATASKKLETSRVR
ncbi:MAG: carboxymuconolactone decarboxylase family protein [Steroidobacteraceae bacterium]